MEECSSIKEKEGLLEMPSECRWSEVIEYDSELREEEYEREKEEEERQEQEEAEEEMEREERLNTALEEISVDNINENHQEVVDFWHGLTDEEIQSFGRIYLGYEARQDGSWHFNTQPIGVEMAQLYYGSCIDIENAVTIVELEGPFTADNYIDMQYAYCYEKVETFDVMMELKENMENASSS